MGFSEDMYHLKLVGQWQQRFSCEWQDCRWPPERYRRPVVLRWKRGCEHWHVSAQRGLTIIREEQDAFTINMQLSYTFTKSYGNIATRTTVHWPQPFMSWPQGPDVKKGRSLADLCCVQAKVQTYNVPAAMNALPVFRTHAAQLRPRIKVCGLQGSANTSKKRQSTACSLIAAPAWATKLKADVIAVRGIINLGCCNASTREAWPKDGVFTRLPASKSAPPKPSTGQKELGSGTSFKPQSTSKPTRMAGYPRGPPM